MKKNIIAFLLLVIFYQFANAIEKKAQTQLVNSFSTNGETVYHLKTGSVKKGERAVITASIDGAVKCFTPHGKLIWEAGTNNGFPFDLCVADIDQDGLDEVLVASANGSLFVFDNNGKSLWTFAKLPPLYQVTVARNANGSVAIITGGVEQILYSISPKGEVVDTLRTTHCIRHIRSGKMGENGTDLVAVATTSSGLTGTLTLMLVDPANLSVVWSKQNLGKHLNDTGKRFFSMLSKDIDKDGYDEILLSGGWGENGIIYAYNRVGELLYSKSDRKIPIVAYRMNLLKSVTLPDDDFILGHFANILIVYNLDGSLRELISCPYSFADSFFDPWLKTLFMGSSVSGGNGIYAIKLDEKGWQEKISSIKPIGRLAEIENNIKALNQQIKDFVPPTYQNKPRPSLLIAHEPRDANYEHLSFVRTVTISQKYENRDELWCKEIDQRRRYDMSADEIVEMVKKLEESGSDFVIWAGHGTAVHFPLSTFETVIAAGPKHLKGFIFAEMEGVTEHMQQVVESILLPVAELCKVNGKLIIFRNKNIFWNGTCYVPFWKKVLLNDRYKDVFVPGLEETNCRSQELSLIGRIGLWQTEYFDHWLGRATTDNANFDRMWEWAGQQVITHHFRNLVSSASLGADIYINSLQTGGLRQDGEDTPSINDQLVPFYDLLEKGIIQIPRRDELLSISDFALGMKSPPSDEYITQGINGHKYTFSTDTNKEMVFDRLDAYWGGSNLDPYDFASYAMNVKYRMTNFMPETPYGMTPIIPAENNTKGRFEKIITTDGEFFYDEQGNAHTASAYQPTVEKALKDAAGRLPVLVNGSVHWSVVKIDEHHLRIVLIDPGYLDPKERKAEIILQRVKGISCTDILSRELQPIIKGKINIKIPAGVCRIVDIEIE